jgi:HK97 family phage portal protein
MGLRDVALRILGAKAEEQRAISVPWDVGGPTRPAAVTPDQALSLIPVFAAVRLLASQVASLPLQAYRKTGDSRMKIPAPSLFVNPSVQGTLYDWLHRAVTSLALRGNAYGLITQRDRDQYPTMVEWLHPDDVFVDDRAASGPGSFANPIWYWCGRVIPAEDLIHIPWFTVPGRVLGLSPIGACAVTVSTGISAQNYTSDWFDNGALPPGEFRNTEKKVDQTEADIISARLNNAIRRRKPLVYGSDWEYKPISVSAHEAKFVETLKMNATQIAAVYGIPPEMIGGETGSSLTYATVEQNSLNFLKFTLRPWLELLEAAFFQLSPRPQYVKFNIDALLRSDLTTRMGSYQIARNIGLNSIDEIRALEDEPPLPGGQGQSYAPLAAAAQPPALRSLDPIDAEIVDDQRIVPAHTPSGIAGAAHLHAYWTTGEGLAKWVDTPHPWTALYHHLLKYLPPGEAKATAAKWYHEVLGHWPGDHHQGKNSAPLLGVSAALALEAKRDDPYHPAAIRPHPADLRADPMPMHADPGLQADGKPRYPIDMPEHVQASWAGINQDAAGYPPEHLAQIKAAIKAAAGRMGLTLKDGAPNAA